MQRLFTLISEKNASDFISPSVRSSATPRTSRSATRTDDGNKALERGYILTGNFDVDYRNQEAYLRKLEQTTGKFLDAAE